MKSIHVFSKAGMAKGQGVASAGEEQINLIKETLSDDFTISINPFGKGDINHYHTINPGFYLKNRFLGRKGVSVGYVHFLPETVDDSIQMPKWMRKIFYWYMIKFYKSMDYHVVVNPYFIHLMQKYNIDTTNTSYIPNFVSSETFYPLPQTEVASLRAKYGLKRDDFVVLGVGQTQTRKGIFDFVEIAEKNPDIQFMWAGGFSFSIMTEGYEEIKRIKENPPKNMKFLGIVDRNDMNGIYNCCDVMFLPSFAELFPMTILEAMAVFKPILLRDLDIYIDILDGYYLSGHDQNDFTTQLRKLKDDPNYYQQAVAMSKKGHDFYNKEHVSKLWKEFYTEISKNKN